MQTENLQIKPKYGYTIVDPEKGKALFYVALGIAIFCPLYFVAYRLIMGHEFMVAWWQAGVLDIKKTPLMVTGTLVTFGGIAMVIWHSCIVKGWKRTVLCLSVAFFIAWFYEFLGVYAFDGGIFGAYHYHPDAMGGQILGVPFGVALGWEIFAYPAFYMVLYLLPSEEMGEDRSFFKRLLNIVVISTVGGIFVLATDILSDPLAVEQGFFTWHVNGQIYPWLMGAGEPLTNFTGWFICGFTMCVAFCFILQETPAKRHYRSKYLDIYAPLAMYAYSFTNNYPQALFMQQRQDVMLFGGISFGAILTIILAKLYLEKRGVQPHPIGKEIAHEAMHKCLQQHEALHKAQKS